MIASRISSGPRIRRSIRASQWLRLSAGYDGALSGRRRLVAAERSRPHESCSCNTPLTYGLRASPTASAASFTASGKRRMGVAGAGDVFRGGAELHRHGGFGDHVAGIGADDMHAEHAVGLGVGEDFHEAVGLLVGLGAAVGGERKLAGVVGDAGLPSTPPRSCRPRRSPG